jgi:hypothetical protein
MERYSQTSRLAPRRPEPYSCSNAFLPERPAVPDLVERLNTTLVGRYAIERELRRGGMAAADCRASGFWTPDS